MYKPYNKEHIERYYVAKTYNEDYSNDFKGNRYSVTYIDLYKDISTNNYYIEVLIAQDLSCDDLEDTKLSFENRSVITVIEFKEFIDYESCDMYLKSNYLPFNKDIHKSIEYLHNDKLYLDYIMSKLNTPYALNGTTFCFIDKDKQYLLPKIKERVKMEMNTVLRVELDNGSIMLETTR